MKRSERNALYRRRQSIARHSAVEGALMSIISAMNTMLVGTLGAAAIASVGLTTQARMLLLICTQGLYVGAMAQCGRRKGGGDRTADNTCLNQSMAIITLLGVLMTLLGFSVLNLVYQL